MCQEKGPNIMMFQVEMLKASEFAPPLSRLTFHNTTIFFFRNFQKEILSVHLVRNSFVNRICYYSNNISSFISKHNSVKDNVETFILPIDAIWVMLSAKQTVHLKMKMCNILSSLHCLIKYFAAVDWKYFEWVLGKTLLQNISRCLQFSKCVQKKYFFIFL